VPGRGPGRPELREEHSSAVAAPRATRQLHVDMMTGVFVSSPEAETHRLLRHVKNVPADCL